MADRIAIREKEINDTKIVLWKNINKYEVNNSYSITISKKEVIFLSIMCQNKRSLSDASSKFDSIILWIKDMIDYGSK